MGKLLIFLLAIIFFTSVAVLALAYLSRLIARGHWLTRRYANLAYGEEKCKACTVGTQLLTPRGWGPIPEPLHGVRKGSRYLGSRQANVRPCPECNATGRVPVTIPGMIDQGHVRYVNEK